MPRDSSGNYELPPGNPVIGDTPIEAAWANATMNDLASAMTNSLSRNGQGGMLAPFKNADGSLGAPGITFTNEAQTGFWRSATGVVHFCIGSNIFTINNAGITLEGTRKIKQQDGASGIELANANDAERIAIAVIEQGGANYLPLTGGALSGPVTVPAGASGSQVPRKSEVDTAIAAAIGAIPDPIKTGMVIDYAGATPPAGYLPCDGALVSRTTYAALFTAIGVLWGAGDGSTTFAVPNLNGKATIGRGTNYPGVIGPNVGDSGGAATHTLTEAQMPSHTHSGSAASAGEHTHTIDITGEGASGSGGASSKPGIPPTPTNLAGAHSHTLTINPAGGNGAHNNLQPSAVMFKIIKT